jgi:Carboxypeptidase regulatory-like domain
MSSRLGSSLNSVALLVIAGVLATSTCRAQGIVDCVVQSRVRTPSVRGIVADPTGVPIPDTLVILEANGERVQQTKTDIDGKFKMNATPGTYRFNVIRPVFTGLDIDLVIGGDFSNAFGRSQLYSVLGLPGSFCPMVWTSANKFHRMIDANKKRLEETSKNNATQK